MSRIKYKDTELLLVKYDIVFKAVFVSSGDLELLASLLSSILDVDMKAEDMVVTNTELPAVYEHDKISRVDIRVKTAEGTHINVEIQLRNEHNIDRRSVYYLSKLYTEQLTAKMEFDEICPAIAINILDFNFLPYPEYHNKYRLKNTNNNEELTDVFEINFIELQKAPKTGIGLKEQWMLFLSTDKEEVLNMLSNENPVMDKAVKRLLYVSADEKLRYEMDMKEKAEIDYWSAMKTNFRKGKEEGREEGARNATYNAVKRALQHGANPSDVAVYLDIPIEKVMEIKATLAP